MQVGRRTAPAGVDQRRPGPPRADRHAAARSTATSRCGRAGSATWCSGRPTPRPRAGSSRRARLQGERRDRQGWPRSCAAPPTTTTSWCRRARCRSCTTPRGWSTTPTRSAGAATPWWPPTRAAPVGTRPPLHRVELVLVPPRPGRELRRVLRRPRRDHRRRAWQPPGSRRHAGPYAWAPPVPPTFLAPDDLGSLMASGSS